MKAAKKSLGSDLDHARRVLNLEADALRHLAEALDGEFTAAVDLFVKVEGRVIVSGMGKSGHIARKIAATFASTGTPAQFVHPGEASHGDMGALTGRDALLVLSNSGETREIIDLLSHSRRYSIPLVGMAGVRKSMLIETADVGLVLPEVPEACPMGLAPTTSTTMMLGLGDAIAVALMERRGFTRDEYRALHPGGQLGKALIRVADLMHKGDELPLVKPDLAMKHVLIEMTGKRFGCAGVVDETGGLIGIITDGDLRRKMSPDLLAQPAKAVMTKKPRTIRAGALAAEAVGIMNNAKSPITCLFVTPDEGDDGPATRPVGIIHIHDCLRAGVA